MSEPPKSKRSSPPTDESLLLRFQHGQNDAATALYLRYARRLRSLVETKRGADLAPRLDADDVVQSVFRTFFRRAAAGHYSVPRGDELWKLLLVIALNKTRDAGAFHRAAKRDVGQTQPLSPGENEPSHRRDDQALSALRMTIDEVLGRLPGSQRQIVELRIEGREVAEIAQKSGRAKRSVERILQEFRDRLRQAIGV
jgi:RNA polymerase sigma-70 factor (ECF subfamily)